jgi:chemotaxis protein CheC
VKLSVDALSTFYEMAREGAGLAADRLTRLTGVDTRVSVSRLDFATPRDVHAALGADDYDAGIRVDLTGGIEGTSVMLFDEGQARTVAHDLVVDVAEPTETLVRTAVTETCQIMNSGFVDGWADVLRTSVDVTTPEYATGAELSSLLGPIDDRAAEAGMALLFRNRIETADGASSMAFEHCLVPDTSSVREWFAADGDASDAGGIAYRKLAGFDRMAQQGANEVATNLTTMTGIEMSVDIRRVNFVSLDAIPESVSNDPLVAVAFAFDGLPSGFMLFLFDESSAGRLVEATVGEAPTGGRLSAAGRDAVQEICNIMASRLLDGWANLLDGTIDHTTPAYCHDLGPAVVDPLIVGLSERQRFAFVFDTRVEAVDGADADEEFDVDVYVIPDQAELEAALDELDVDRVRETPTTADLRIDELSAAELAEAGEVDGDDLVSDDGGSVVDTDADASAATDDRARSGTGPAEPTGGDAG